jgi:hypothetical protein
LGLSEVHDERASEGLSKSSKASLVDSDFEMRGVYAHTAPTNELLCKERNVELLFAINL